MLHPLGVPFKPSYLILAAIPFVLLATTLSYIPTDRNRNRRLARYMGPIIGIGLVGCLGELYLRTLGDPGTGYPVFQQLVIYSFMVFAFALGQRARGFPFGALVWILYGLLAIILVLSLAGDRVPVLAQLWWKTEEEIAFRLASNETRPVPFGDGSMVAANILLLFLVASMRFGFLKLRFAHVMVISGSVLFTAVLLQGRNQIAASIILLVALALTRLGKERYRILNYVLILGGTAVLITAFQGPIRGGIPVMDRAFGRIERTELFNIQQERHATVLRPLLHWERFKDRWKASPIIGTGFSTIPEYPFHRLNFHNDWLYVLATSGTMGGVLFLMFAVRIWRSLGLLVLLPLALPGLTNSFITHVSGVIVYTFMLGLLIEKRQNQLLRTRFTKGFNSGDGSHRTSSSEGFGVPEVRPVL